MGATDTKLEDCTRIMTQMTQHPEFAQVIARQGWVLVLQKLVDNKFSCVRELIEHLPLATKESKECLPRGLGCPYPIAGIAAGR